MAIKVNEDIVDLLELLPEASSGVLAAPAASAPSCTPPAAAPPPRAALLFSCSIRSSTGAMGW